MVRPARGDCGLCSSCRRAADVRFQCEWRDRWISVAEIPYARSSRGLCARSEEAMAKAGSGQKAVRGGGDELLRDGYEIPHRQDPCGKPSRPLLRTNARLL